MTKENFRVGRHEYVENGIAVVENTFYSFNSFDIPYVGMVFGIVDDNSFYSKGRIIEAIQFPKEYEDHEHLYRVKYINVQR